MTHDGLVEAGRKWLAARSPIVITEIVGTSEEPDVFGLNAEVKCMRDGVCCRTYGSTLLECKASRSDFRADAKKYFRREPWLGIGQNRYYLTPVGLIKPEELPDNWGLLETTGKRIKIIKMAKPFKEYNTKNEMHIIISTFRRLRVPDGNHCSIRAYTYETKNKATLTMNYELDYE